MGYVGTPLALAFSDYYPVIGYDIDPVRICELHNNFDRNLENKNFLVKNLTISNNLSDIQKSNIYIIAVPTPLTQNDQPDLSYIENATRSVAQFVCPGDIIIYESSFYPGLTEEFCVPWMFIPMNGFCMSIGLFIILIIGCHPIGIGFGACVSSHCVALSCGGYA